MTGTNSHPRPDRMRLRGVLDEAARNLASGTSHACAMAVKLACLMMLCVTADLASITAIQRQADSFVASGGSTYSITYTGHIDGAACDRLVSLDGVIAAGAVRGTAGKLTFAALPSTGVPTYEVTTGATGVFANSTTAARDAVRPDAALSGVWLSQEAAKPLGVRAGGRVTLRDDRTVDVAGVYDWPDDGRQSGYSYAAITPVPASDDEPFDQCWVKAWPVPENLESLLRVTTMGDESATQERPTVAQLNTTQGRTFDAIAAYRGRLTAWAPLVAGVVALLVGWIAVHLRRLELASALHCGVPKPAMVAGVLVETGVWALIAIAMCTPALAWMWLANTDADAMVLTDTLLRVPAAAYVGVFVGALARAATIRERQLFRYFKNR
ncbi:hypothetical protein CSQ85_07960 [Bifidobacterium rousetti]|uniref:hypothetical protein n=1 Tax=Bifidobacterium rousetti TaxID=2045439 RepID=UPI00123C405A|nr:hypothetical protein [Bifidobacterium rousetti]KAA8818435.1 hypothetical protein CSQ85_07960 [Bifidobacterium rousetti]